MATTGNLSSSSDAGMVAMFSSVLRSALRATAGGAEAMSFATRSTSLGSAFGPNRLRTNLSVVPRKSFLKFARKASTCSALGGFSKLLYSSTQTSPATLPGSRFAASTTTSLPID